MEIPDGSELFPGGVRADDGGAKRSAIRSPKNVLLVERAVLALCDYSDAESPGKSLAELSAEYRYARRLSASPASLHPHPTQERQPLYCGGGESGHGFMGGAR